MQFHPLNIIFCLHKDNYIIYNYDAGCLEYSTTSYVIGYAGQIFLLAVIFGQNNVSRAENVHVYCVLIDIRSFKGFPTCRLKVFQRFLCGMKSLAS